MKRLDQDHLHPKLEVPGLTCHCQTDSLLIAIPNIYIWARDNNDIPWILILPRCRGRWYSPGFELSSPKSQRGFVQNSSLSTFPELNFNRKLSIGTFIHSNVRSVCTFYKSLYVLQMLHTEKEKGSSGFISIKRFVNPVYLVHKQYEHCKS